MSEVTIEQAYYWIHAYRPRICFDCPEPGMVELIGMTKDKYHYHASGRTIQECVIKIKEIIKC